jgi:hypothetical protein
MMKPKLMTWWLIIGLMACGQIHLSAQDTSAVRVLFVGNSFTYFYNLPQVVMAMAESQGAKIETRQSTVGGSSLEQHWKREKGTRTMALLETGDWDYVVFNNHSTSSLDTPESFMEYGGKFADLVREKGAEPIFMLTWAYKSNPLMQAGITEMHERLARENNAGFVPAGPIFAAARKWRPDMELFFDDKHPSANGTYLLGLAFYKYFTGATTADIPPRLLTEDLNGEKLYLMFMPPEEADFLQQLVDEFTFTTLSIPVKND